MLAFSFLTLCFLVIAMSVTMAAHFLTGLSLLSLSPLVFAILWLCSLVHFYRQQRKEQQKTANRFHQITQALNYQQNHGELVQDTMRKLEKQHQSQDEALQRQTFAELETMKDDVTTLSMMLQQLTEALSELDERVSSPLLTFVGSDREPSFYLNDQNMKEHVSASPEHALQFDHRAFLSNTPLSVSTYSGGAFSGNVLSGQSLVHESVTSHGGASGAQFSSRNDEAGEPLQAAKSQPAFNKPSGKTALALHNDQDRHTRQILDHVRACVRDKKIDLALQPIVSLPRKKPKFYECFAQLKLAESHALEAKSALPVIEAAGVCDEFDLCVLDHAFGIARRLGARNSQLKIFVNIAHQSLLSQHFVEAVLEQLRGSGSVVRHLVLEIKQSCWDAASPLEKDALLSFREAGCALSLDHVNHMDFDVSALALAGFRYMKLSADFVLSMPHHYQGDIHPEDLVAFCARKDMTLIVDHIEHEAVLRDVLDYHFAYGQGYLFARPKTVSSARKDKAMADNADAHSNAHQHADKQVHEDNNAIAPMHQNSAPVQEKVTSAPQPEAFNSQAASPFLADDFKDYDTKKTEASSSNHAKQSRKPPLEEMVSSSASAQNVASAGAGGGHQEDHADVTLKPEKTHMFKSIKNSAIPEDAIEDILQSVRV
jgi:cyclic-di-GMP phosphodiesterase TipF (flagellum assembly factor)